MNQILITQLLCILGVVTYFVIKARKQSLTATAANETFSILIFLKNDWFDIVLAIIIAIVAMNSNASFLSGLKLDFSSGLASFTSGIGIGSVGVNLILGIFGLGDKTNKKIRSTITEKTYSK